MPKKKNKTMQVRVSMNEDDFDMVEDYFEKHPEFVKQIIYGSAIAQKVKRMKEIDND